MLANQGGNWRVAESRAEEVGDGKYRWTLPAGVTDAGRTRIRATISDALFFANGFAHIDQRAGGLLAGRRRTCRRRAVMRFRAKRRVRARVSAGRVRVRGRRIRVNLRGVDRAPVRLRVRAAGRTQTRILRTCA